MPKILTPLISGESEKNDGLLATSKAKVLVFESLQMFGTMISISLPLVRLARVNKNSGFCMVTDSSLPIFTYKNNLAPWLKPHDPNFRKVIDEKWGSKKNSKMEITEICHFVRKHLKEGKGGQEEC